MTILTMSEKSIEKQDTTNSWVIGEDGHKLTISRGYSIVNAPTMNGLSINATGKGHTFIFCQVYRRKLCNGDDVNSV